MNEYRLSIIVPCYNSSNTIGKLLDSVLNNNLEKDTYEVIIVDDNSADNFMDIVDTYRDKMNINYYKTDTKVHCPGNTRQVGLSNAKGEWITFIDHDDYFSPNTINKVFKKIEANHIDTVLCTSFFGVLKNKKQKYSGSDNIPWLHGKFYNHKMLLDGNIKFKEDLKTHEDVYFNNVIELYLAMNKKKMFSAYDILTYNWVQRIDSLSHYEKDGLKYMDINFKDYIYATCEPIFNLPSKYSNYKTEKILKNFLMFYFTYEQGIYRLGNKYAEINLKPMIDLKLRINTDLGINDKTILDFLYKDAEYYHALKGKVFTNIDCPFIEQHSLIDFIRMLDECFIQGN